MNAVVDVGLPVFAIAGAGWLGGRLGAFDIAGSKALNDFVYWAAFPALIFLSVSRVPIERSLDGPLLAGYGGGALAAFAVCFIAGAVFTRQTVGELVVRGQTVTFANTGYMGVPLLLTAFGEPGLLVALVLTVVNGAVMMGLAVLMIELGRGGGFARIPSAVLEVVRNPLLAAAVAGLAVAWTDPPLPEALVTFAEILGAAAPPAALFSMGLFIALNDLRAGGMAALGEVAWLSLLKLVVQPAVTWWLCGPVMGLPDVTVASAVLCAALPTGTLVFVNAYRYRLAVERTTQTILVSTVLSVVTVSGLLAWFVPG